jgi:hypothetical protein
MARQIRTRMSSESSRPSRLSGKMRPHIRAIAVRVVRENRNRWACLKEQIIAGHDVGWGGYMQVEFSGVVYHVVSRLTPAEREKFSAETGPQFDSRAMSLICNAVIGEIYVRARAAAARSELRW